MPGPTKPSGQPTAHSAGLVGAVMGAGFVAVLVLSFVLPFRVADDELGHFVMRLLPLAYAVACGAILHAWEASHFRRLGAWARQAGVQLPPPVPRFEALPLVAFLFAGLVYVLIFSRVALGMVQDGLLQGLLLVAVVGGIPLVFVLRHRTARQRWDAFAAYQQRNPPPPGTAVLPPATSLSGQALAAAATTILVLLGVLIVSCFALILSLSGAL